MPDRHDEADEADEADHADDAHDADEAHDADDAVRDLGLSGLLPIVVGAHLAAEVSDRAIAYGLRRTILDWRPADAPAPDESASLRPVVLTDVWYLNDQALRLQPTICVGGPEVNAATAFHASRIPTALIVEDAYRIQLDPEGLDTAACLWGTDPVRTAEAVACFVARYLDAFLETANLLRR